MQGQNDITSHRAVSPASIRRALLTALAVGLLAAFLAPPPPPPAHAQQVDESLPPLADLAITSEYRDSARVIWKVTVKNNTVGAHPGMHVHLVKVRITISAPERSTSTQVWTIRNLAPGASRSSEIRSLYNIPGVTTGLERVPQRLYAEIIESDPAESPRFGFNNATEHWAIELRRATLGGNGVTRFTSGDFAIDGISVSDRSPRPEEATTFTVNTYNPYRSIPGIALARQDHTLFDVQVKISLSPGLSFADTQPEAPSHFYGSTTFATTTGIWNVGAMPRMRFNLLSLPVAVNLTADSLADLPLEERCLTAEVVNAVPWFANDPLKRVNDTATACLGTVLLAEGEVTLFDYIDCVGATTTPCTSADTLELLVDLSEGEYLPPEEVIVHIQEPQGRNAGKWRTGKSTHHNTGIADTPGVGATFSFVPSGYTQYHFAVSDVSPKQRPGAFSILSGAAATTNLLDADTKLTFPPTDLPSSFTTPPYPTFLVFSTLGTYKLNLTVGAAKSSTAYTATGTYTFHVGPIAELEVRDAGANPEVATDRSAYTILAVNNGPDTAPAVRVTGLPTGVTEFFASVGEYDPASGVWTIGELRPGYDHRPSVHAAEGPALTLVTDDPAAPDFTATIENAQDYCVRIKDDDPDPENDLECTGSVPTGYTEHSTAYYDHVPGNNTATIAARAGTGERAGAPGGVKVTETPVANILTWQPVESVYEHAVTRYEVQRATSTWMTLDSDVDGTVYLDMDPGSGDPEYRVRAVNEFGVPGPWSESSGRTPGVPKSFTAAVAGSAQITLSWSAPDAVTGVSVAGYEIEVSSDGGDTWTQLAADHSASPYAHNDGTLSPGATRDYRVRTVGMVGSKKLKSGWAAASAEVPYPTPGVPKSFAASGSSDTQAALSWGAPDTVSGVSVTGYELDFSTDGGNTWNWLPTGATRTVLSASTLSHPHTDTTLAADAVRQYRLRTVGSVGGVTVWSGYTYALATRDYPTPGAPRDFTALAVNRSQVNLSWSEPEAVSGVRLTGYHLEFSTDGNTWNRLPAAMSVLATSTTRHEHVDAALSAGAIRQYRVRAVGADSNNAVFESGWVFASAATEEVGPPRNLSASAYGSGRIDLAWDEPAFGASLVTGYRIDHTPASPEQWRTLEHGYRASPRSYEHAGLSPGQRYCYRVAAVYAGGTGPFSALGCATTEVVPTHLPGEPRNLRVSRVGSNFVTLEWDAPSEGGDVEYYEWRSNAHAPTVVSPRTATRVTVRGLLTGSSYDFQVRAGNADHGRGQWSGSVYAALSQAGSALAASPLKLDVARGGSGSFKVRLNRSPQWPLLVYFHWDGPECLTGGLVYQQAKILLPSSPKPSRAFWSDGWWGPPEDRHAAAWNAGVDIRVDVPADASACHAGATAVVQYSVSSLPFSYLAGISLWADLGLDEEHWRGEWGIDPLDAASGPSIKLTVVDPD